MNILMTDSNHKCFLIYISNIYLHKLVFQRNKSGFLWAPLEYISTLVRTFWIPPPHHFLQLDFYLCIYCFIVSFWIKSHHWCIFIINCLYRDKTKIKKQCRWNAEIWTYFYTQCGNCEPSVLRLPYISNSLHRKKISGDIVFCSTLTLSPWFIHCIFALFLHASKLMSHVYF